MLSLPCTRCVGCSRPLLRLLSGAGSPDWRQLWRTLPIAHTIPSPAYTRRLHASAASSAAPHPSTVWAASTSESATAQSASLASLRSAWPSVASSSAPSWPSPFPSPSSSPSTPAAPPLSTRASSTSQSALSPAEQRAVSLAQREAEAERRRQHEAAATAAAAPNARRTLFNAASTSSAPPATPTRSSVSSRSFPLSPSESVQLSPLLQPLSGPSSSTALSEAEEAEQLALIDELTDYIRAYKQPSVDKANARAESSTPPPSLHEEDYFLGRPRTTAAYTQLIHNHAAAGAVEQGLAIAQSMSRSGVTPDSGTYAALVRVCGALPASATAAEKERTLRRAFDLLPAMAQAGVAPTVSFFNVLIDACTRLSSPERAQSVLSLMASHGVAADVVTYTSLLAVYRDPGVGVQQLKQLWFDLRNSGHQPDAVAYNTAIRAVAQHGEAEYALMLFNDMAQDGVQASTYTYNALMYACARRPDFYLRAFDLFAQAMAGRHALDKHSYSILLYAAARNRDVGNAIKLFEQMAVAGVERDTAAYNTLLHCIANSQQHTTCKLSGSVLDVSQKDRIVMCERLLVQMEANAVPVDDRTVLAALRVWTEALRLRTAEAKRTELIARYVRLDREEQRRAGRGDFDVRLWEAMLQMYSRARRTAEAVALLQRLEAEGLLASVRAAVLQRALHMCAQQADEASGVWLLQAMRRVNVEAGSEREVRLFDVEQYRQWLQRQSGDKRQGAVPAMAERDRQQLRDRAWFGSKALRQASRPQSPQGTARRQQWWPSNTERKAREKAEVRRRKEDKRLAWESR